MPKITGFIHAYSAADAPRLARALDSLRVCDEVLVINHYSSEQVAHVCCEHGARVNTGIPGVSPGAYLFDASHDWILCVLPSEALSEALAASLLQWKDREHETSAAFSAAVRDERENGWHSLTPETRLVNRNAVNWTGNLPANNPKAELLPGDILRFSVP